MSEEQLPAVWHELLQVRAAEPGSAAALEESVRRLFAAHARLREQSAELTRDNSELLARNAQLEREVQARDELLSVIGHELRNPIAPLFMHVRALLMHVRSAECDQVDADWLTRRLERMEPHMDRFLSVLDRILDVSRLSSGRVDLELEAMDLTQAVSDVLERYAQETAAARCELRTTHPGSILGTWDRLRIEQIVANLISNAIRYGAGAPVDVMLSATDTAAVIEVRDRGVGIAPEDHARIFERFERAKRREQGGFGVGLWVVKNLCSALGGEVSVESASGQGATFRVSLPRGVIPNT